MEKPVPQGLQGWQGRPAEYAALRQEIVQYNQVTMLALAISLPITAGLIAYGFTYHNTLALFSAAGVLDISLWFVSALVRSSIIIATYLYAIVESKENGMFWEHMVTAMRRGGRAPSRSYVTLWAVLPLVCVGCILLGWAYTTVETLADLGSIAVASGLLIVFQFIPFWRAYWYSSRKYYDGMCERWLKVYMSV